MNRKEILESRVNRMHVGSWVEIKCNAALVGPNIMRKPLRLS